MFRFVYDSLWPFPDAIKNLQHIQSKAIFITESFTMELRYLWRCDMAASAHYELVKYSSSYTLTKIINLLFSPTFPQLDLRYLPIFKEQQNQQFTIDRRGTLIRHSFKPCFIHIHLWPYVETHFSIFSNNSFMMSLIELKLFDAKAMSTYNISWQL